MAINEKGDSRRLFLRNSGAALLAGYAFNNRNGLAQNVARPDAGRYQSVVIRTHHNTSSGPVDERLDFPKDWKIDIMHMVGVKNTPLTSAQILQKLRTPIGSKQLRDIAAGKKNAAISFDDSSRPTYFGDVAEQVINELNLAGIDDDHILFIGAVGTHHDISPVVAMGKLGPRVYARCTWTTHNCFPGCCIQQGRTSWNNMIEANSYMVKADVRIHMGSIRQHGGYGFGGGPKGVIPGLVSLNSVYYNHTVVGGINRGNRSYEGDTRAQDASSDIPSFTKMGFPGPFNRRADALEAARLVPIDFSINIIHNGTRECIDLFCGDINEAHLAGSEVANELQCYDHAAKAGEFDITVVNADPCTQTPAGFATPREGGIAVAVRQSSDLGQYHRLHESGSANLQAYPFRAAGTAPNYRRIMLSAFEGKKGGAGTGSGVEIFPTWDNILPLLEQNMKTGARVLLYPYSGNCWAKVVPRPAAAAPAGGAAAPAGGARQGGARQGGGGEE